jgi:hypothetical protein
LNGQTGHSNLLITQYLENPLLDLTEKSKGLMDFKLGTLMHPKE